MSSSTVPNDSSDRDELLTEKPANNALHDTTDLESQVFNFEVKRDRRQSTTTHRGESEHVRSRFTTEEAMDEAGPAWITGRRLFAVQIAILLS